MAADQYTKCVLTVIAVALAVIAVQNLIPTAFAQVDRCGDAASNPCYVAGSLGSPIYVQADPNNAFYVATKQSSPLDVRVSRN
jgi:hypothetical protein